MRPKVVLAALAVLAALGGSTVAQAADRDDYYVNGYHYYPDRNHAYYAYPDRTYTYYYVHPDRGYTYYYGDGDYYGYGDPHRNYLNEYRGDRWDPYGINGHDTN